MNKINNSDQLRLIIFDFDGTLANTQSLILRTMRMSLEEMALEVPSEERCASVIGLPLSEIIEALYQNSDRQLAQTFSDTYRRLFAENNVPGAVTAFPGVKPTLETLKSRGLLLSVATSRTHQSLDMLTKDLGIHHLFSYMLGCDDVQLAKPHPEPVLRTLKALNVTAAETLVVGDAVYDIQMGQRAGCRTCGVTYGNGTPEAIRSVSPTFIIDAFPQLLSLPPLSVPQ